MPCDASKQAARSLSSCGRGTRIYGSSLPYWADKYVSLNLLLIYIKVQKDKIKGKPHKNRNRGVPIFQFRILRKNGQDINIEIRMYLHYTPIGWLYIFPQDDCGAIVDAMVATDYDKEFCVAEGFDPEFTARLMEAGFLVMSVNIGEDEPDYIMLPKLHLERSVLFFEKLRVKKSIRRFLTRYELRADVEFDRIVDRCVEKHGEEWLTPPLVDCIKKIRSRAPGSQEKGRLEPAPHAYPASFALYRDGELAAGEFGVVCGNIYTSYSGFYEEDNAGTVQLILTARYLQEHGFSFMDLGMPLDYKTDLGAVDITPKEFVRLFRAGS